MWRNRSSCSYRTSVTRSNNLDLFIYLFKDISQRYPFCQSLKILLQLIQQIFRLRKEKQKATIGRLLLTLLTAPATLSSHPAEGKAPAAASRGAPEPRLRQSEARAHQLREALRARRLPGGHHRRVQVGRKARGTEAAPPGGTPTRAGAAAEAARPEDGGRRDIGRLPVGTLRIRDRALPVGRLPC